MCRPGHRCARLALRKVRVSRPRRSAEHAHGRPRASSIAVLGGVEAGRHHDRRARAEAAKLVDQTRHRRRRRADDGQVRLFRKVGDAGRDRFAVEATVLEVDGADRAGVSAGTQVPPDRRTDARRAVGGTDQPRCGRLSMQSRWRTLMETFVLCPAAEPPSHAERALMRQIIVASSTACKTNRRRSTQPVSGPSNPGEAGGRWRAAASPS